MNTKLITLFAIVLCFAAITPASADFIGAYDVSNWASITEQGGTIDTTGAPSSITLTSGNDYGDVADPPGPISNQDFTIAATATGDVSFDWFYTTYDYYDTVDFASVYDPFGYLLNGVFHQLSPNDLPYLGTSSGSVSFAVIAGDVFGFRANSDDSAFGPAVTTVSNFNGPTAVPLPATLWLMSLGLAAMGFRRRQAA
jgi:hypothetical protein